MKKVIIPNLKVGEVHLDPVSKVRSLGLTLDSYLSMEPQICSCIRSSFYHIRQIRRIRDYLNPNATKQAVHARVTSRLDMYNSTLIGLPETHLKRLQKVQNSAARLVKRSKLSDHITPVLKELHWLPVKQRLKYKVLSLVFKLKMNQTPVYLSDLLEVKRGRRGLRSGDSDQLQEVRVKRSWGDRSFSVAAPRLWNSLPSDIKTCKSPELFHNKLKTHLMSQAYA